MRQGQTVADARYKRLLALISQLSGKASSGASGNSFVLGPGMPQALNRYPTFPALYEAATSTVLGPVSVLVNDTVAPAHMTSGNYALDNWTFAGENASSSFTLHIDPGVTIQSSCLRFITGLIVSNEATATPWTPSTFAEMFLEGDGTTVQSAAGAAPFVHVTADGSGFATFLDAGTFLGDTAHHLITVDAGETSIVFYPGAGAVTAHCFAGLGTVDVSLTAEGLFTLPQDITTVSILDIAKGAQVSYTATTVANWSGTNPSSVANALDRIAAKITPIP